MITVLLVDTSPNMARIVGEVENMCHYVGIGVMVHREDEDLEDLLDSLEGAVVAFSPKGEMTVDEMARKYDGQKDVVLVIGGFTEERELDRAIIERADAVVSLGEKFLEIPAVVDGIIEGYKKEYEKKGQERDE